MVVTPAQGTGKPCPEMLAEEMRECSKDCPKGAPNLTAEVNTNKEQHGDVELKMEAGGVGDGAVRGGEQQEQACSLEEEVWTPCSVDCLQERYMGDGCKKEAEVCVTLFLYELGTSKTGRPCTDSSTTVSGSWSEVFR